MPNVSPLTNYQRGISIVAVCHLPKVKAPVRFRYPAFADVAQPVEQCFRKAEVVGSIPTVGSRKQFLAKKRLFFDFKI